MEQWELIENFRKNPAALQSLMYSPDGQQLLRSLQGNDGGKTLSRAVKEAAGGNSAEMVHLLQQVMSSPDGAALIRRIGEALQKQS